MLTRLNTSSDLSILPSALGSTFPPAPRRPIVPPDRRRVTYNHSMSTSSKNSFDQDPNAPAANMSMRAEQDYFGPDVLVILGVVMAGGGAILTLISFYCEFKHPAIQATMAGIGPSLVGIGMLFCVLRLFFCTFCTMRTCCRFLSSCCRKTMLRCPCVEKAKRILPTKKKVHPIGGKPFKPNPPLRLPDTSSKKQSVGDAKDSDNGAKRSKQGTGHLDCKAGENSVKVKQKSVAFNHVILESEFESQSMEMTSPSEGQSKGHLHGDSGENEAGNRESEIRSSPDENQNHHAHVLFSPEPDVDNANSIDITEDLIGQCSDLEVSVSSSFASRRIDDEILKDEIAILDEIKQERRNSEDFHKDFHRTISEIGLNQEKR